MPIADQAVHAQIDAVRAGIGAQPWQGRYPSYTHDKNHPVQRPKLIAHIIVMEPGPDTVIVRAHISNIGSGASYNTLLQFYYAGIIAQAPGQPPPPPLHQRLMVHERRVATIQPGETQELTFTATHPPAPIMMADWLGALVCCDPIADPLPMHAWHELLQSANNLLPGAENPPLVAPIPHWDEFDGPNAVQPRLQNRTWRGRNANPDSFPRFLADGRPAPARAYFAPYASAPDSELRQMIALAPFTPLIDQGDLALTLRGRVRSFAQPNPDETQIVLECMAANGDTLVTLDLGKHAFTDAWHLLAGTILAPVGTRQAQIRLRSIRHSGRNNDGYFDAVQLIPSHRKIAAALRSSFI